MIFKGAMSKLATRSFSTILFPKFFSPISSSFPIKQFPSMCKFSTIPSTEKKTSNENSNETNDETFLLNKKIRKDDEDDFRSDLKVMILSSLGIGSIYIIILCCDYWKEMLSNSARKNRVEVDRLIEELNFLRGHHEKELKKLENVGKVVK